MIPLDKYQKWAARLDASAVRYLNEEEYRAYRAIPGEERLRQLDALLHRPIARFSAVNDAFFRARWAEVLQAAHPNRPLTLLEIASGDADMIPQMMACDAPGSRYISANMNKRLTAGLIEKTRGLSITVEVIEEDAAGIDRRLPAGCADLIAFQHAVNDVWQAILCGREGIDTIDIDWMQTLPAMIAILQRETAQDTLEQHVKPGWLALMDSLGRVLKPGGLAAMNHYMFQLDLDWGYPPGLWENIIPLASAWSRDIPGWTEVTLDGFAPQWWLFLRKD